MLKRNKPARAKAAGKVSAKAAPAADLRAQAAAIDKSMAVIEFGLDGTILGANDNYCRMIGYTVEELRGKSMLTLLDPAQRSSEDNQRLLEKLGRGEVDAGVQKRIGKGGREIWIQATVNPIPDRSGKPCKVVTYACDVTAQVEAAAASKGLIEAINRVQAVIEFALDGTILAANENFLRTLGYSLEEIRGQHHRMFVEAAYAASDEYRQFWEKLGHGEYDAGQYKRLAKGGREVWIQASYNPILNADGKPYKVVKFATDITGNMKAAENARVRTALDKAGANIVLADEQLNIVYLNEAAQQLFRGMQGDLKRERPGFDADKLLGASVDMFHDHPAQHRQLLADLRGQHTEELYLGGRLLKLSAIPVNDADGKRVGTMTEWWDRTQEVSVQEEVAEIVRRALDNDLSLRVGMDGKSGFLASLGSGLNKLLDNTAGMVRDIKSAAAAVRMGAEEISKGNANLSQRTEEQSSSLEETASSMEQMTSTVKQNADNAGQANQLATAARDQAEKGGVVVGKAVRAMTEINEASKKIADIIGVIDEIAFQTNLLALNAAVEAARAGEQGRGFAVVATEVRSLAGRSATAAKEIKGLIKDSVRKVEDGSSLVTQSGQTLEQIVASVKKVSDIIAEIAAASREQSSGIEQVNKAVMQMDEMTQQNAALVEEATAASQAMAEGAGELNRMMERFTLPAAKAPAAAASASPAPPAAAAAPQSERRGPSRPWSGNGKAPGGEAARPKAAAAAGEWQDF
jgi:methyl-accepting chemotaxis protein